MHLRLRSVVGFVSLIFGALVLLGCSASTEIVALDNTVQPTVDEPETANQTADSNAELSSDQVYSKIEDSVVFVLAPDGQSSGSGIVIEGGWILTNAHVVERHREMTIGRSDGQDIGLYPVHAVDWTFDLALVGPVDDASLVPMQRGISADLDLGDRVMLAGFPDEDSNAPTPTFTEGIVSRRRFVALGDYPFLQIDATIAPGQSGGAMVNGNGELVGISGLEFGEGEFGLVFASDPMWPRVDDMAAAPSSEIPTNPPVDELSGEVGPLTNFGFVVESDETGQISLDVFGEDDIWVDLQTLSGATLNQSQASDDPFRGLGVEANFFVDERSDGIETVQATVEPGTYQVVISTFGETNSTVRASASAGSIIPFDDVEERATLPLDEVVEGTFDWSQDTDKWELPLDPGDRVSIRADGISDTVIVVRLDDEVIAMSDDEGLGLFGTGSEVDFAANETGVYIVEVGSYDNDRWGYLIQATIN